MRAVWGGSVRVGSAAQQQTDDCGGVRCRVAPTAEVHAEIKLLQRERDHRAMLHKLEEGVRKARDQAALDKHNAVRASPSLLPPLLPSSCLPRSARLYGVSAMGRFCAPSLLPAVPSLTFRLARSLLPVSYKKLPPPLPPCLPFSLGSGRR
jgi:hypothetical protein